MVFGYPGSDEPSPPDSGKHHAPPMTPAAPPSPLPPPPPPAVPPMQPTEKAIPIEPAPPKEKDTSMIADLFGENAKAIVSFAVTFGAQILARTVNESGPVLPDDWKGWASLIGGSLLAAGLVWLKSNTESVEGLQRKLDKAAAKG